MNTVYRFTGTRMNAMEPLSYEFGLGLRRGNRGNVVLRNGGLRPRPRVRRNPLESNIYGFVSDGIGFNLWTIDSRGNRNICALDEVTVIHVGHIESDGEITWTEVTA